jgi:hypothetical protein
MFPGTHMEILTRAPTAAERMTKGNRTGHHATVYEVRKDPKLLNTNIIRDMKELSKFPFVSGKSYKGQWKDDVKQGFGAEVNPDGTKYEGEWENNKRHGKGTLFKKVGKKLIRTYVGEWEAGYMSGHGTMYYPDGEIFRGEWKKNKRAGKGRLDINGGDFYDGDWLGDQRNGYGSLFHANGNSYEGLWMDGLKEGPGRYFYAATNKVYEGEWAEDQPRCGEYREPSGEELSRFSEPTVRRQAFDLPEIRLEQPGEVLDMAITNVRMENSGRRGMVKTGNQPVLSEDNLEELRRIFGSLDLAREGIVLLSRLGPFFGALGFPDQMDDAMVGLFNQLEIELDQAFSFPEAIDIVNYMLNVF